MQVKIKKHNADGMVRLESSGEIKEVMVNEDIMHPSKETIAVGFMGKDSSGIIEFSPNEIERLYASVKQRMHLIRSFKTFKEHA